MTFEQIVGLGKYESKIHNLNEGNPSFDVAQVNYIVVMGSDVKSNYSKYGIVVEILNNTSALIRAGVRIFKYPLYELVPALREKPS